MGAAPHTNHGDIVVELCPNHAPKTVANLVELATDKREWTNPATGEKATESLYNGTTFHRVIDGFMTQEGGPLGCETRGPGYQFEGEIHPELDSNDPHALVMVNAGPGINGSQFFIIVAPTTWLHGRHTVFGKVVDDASEAVVDKIAKASTGTRDKPAEDAIIEPADVAE